MRTFGKSIAALGAATAAVIGLSSTSAAAADNPIWMDVRPAFTKHCNDTNTAIYDKLFVQSCVVDNGAGYAQAVLIVSNQTASSITMDVEVESFSTIYEDPLNCPRRTVTPGKQIACVAPTERVGRGKDVRVWHHIRANGDFGQTVAYDYKMK
ncbi:hypothetical protein [Streptomyces sp. MNP-20]|uniref:hypothetical protein n=1 Tax=Streptomyces sp. MNP-20 TaxID=2721165 RepID=UPI001557E238|nr:hypothetical protein [Streptomyces sp. MNP-20]